MTDVTYYEVVYYRPYLCKPEDDPETPHILLMLGQRLRRWPNINLALGQRLVSVG